MNREELILKIKNLNQIYKWNEAKQRKKEYMYDYIREWKREWYNTNLNQGRINNYIYRYRLNKDEIASCGNDLDKYKQLAKEKRSIGL